MVGVTADSADDRPTVRIGVGAPLSGNGADLGQEMTRAIQLAIDEANAKDVVPEAKLELLVRDDKGNEDEGAAIAEEFVIDRLVLAVIGHYNSDVTLRVGALYADGGVPLISPIVSNPKLTESGWSNVLRFTNRDDVTATAIANYLVDRLGKRRAVVVQTSTVYGMSMSQHFTRAFERVGGTILARHSVEEGCTAFGELVRTFPAAMDLLFYGGTFEGAPLLKAARSSGVLQLMATGDGCWDVSNFLEPAGVAAEVGEGVLVLSACPEIGTVPGSRDFASRYANRFGPVKNYAVNCYDAATLLTQAIGSTVAGGAGVIGRAHVLSALRKSRYRGIAYPDLVTWDEKGDNVGTLTALHVATGGQFRQVAVVRKQDN